MYNEYFEKLENLKGKELKNTELKAEKIELGSVKEIQQQTKKIENILKSYKGLEKELKKAKNIFENAKKLNDEGYDISNKSTKIGREFISNAKKLGLDVTEVKEFREYAKVSSELVNQNAKILRLLPR